MRTLQHKTKYYVIYGGKKELWHGVVTKEDAETMYYGYKNAVGNGWVEADGVVTLKEEWR